MDSYYYILLYLLLVNGYSFWLMFSDKRKAIKDKYRIPEKKLFMWAILGGSIGSMLGMEAFRHKTKHPTFRIGMPAILIVEIYLFAEYGMPLLA